VKWPRRQAKTATTEIKERKITLPPKNRAPETSTYTAKCTQRDSPGVSVGRREEETTQVKESPEWEAFIRFQKSALGS